MKALDTYDFSDTDICLMSAGGTVSKEWSPRIGAEGCLVAFVHPAASGGVLLELVQTVD